MDWCISYCRPESSWFSRGVGEASGSYKFGLWVGINSKVARYYCTLFTLNKWKLGPIRICHEPGFLEIENFLPKISFWVRPSCILHKWQMTLDLEENPSGWKGIVQHESSHTNFRLRKVYTTKHRQINAQYGWTRKSNGHLALRMTLQNGTIHLSLDSLAKQCFKHPLMHCCSGNCWRIL